METLQKIVDVASGTVTYTGYAAAGTGTSAPGWHIEKAVINGNITTTYFPASRKGPLSASVFCWADRASYTYALSLDVVVPTLTTVTIASDNSDTTKAMVGDTVTLTIVAAEAIETPYVTIAGKVATVTASSLTNYTASYVMTSAETAGVIAFRIGFTDKTGNVGTPVIAKTGGSDVTFDKVAPTVSLCSIISNNTNTAYATTGDEITLTFTATELLKTKPTVMIAGHTIAGADVTMVGTAASWSAVYVMQGADDEGHVSLSINGFDLTGNALVEKTGVTDGSSVTFDKTAPTLGTVTIVSNNADTKKAKTGDDITLTFVSNEALISKPTVEIAGHAIDAGDVTGSGVNWSAVYTMVGGDTTGAVAFTINGFNLAGVPLAEVTAVTAGGDVIFDKTAPLLTTVTIASDNVIDNKMAKSGDTVTLTIISDSDLKASPTFTLAGHTVLAIAGIDAKHWTAEYEFAITDTDGTVAFTVNGFDLTGNPMVEVTAVTGGGDVTFDKTAPTLDSATNVSATSLNVLLSELALTASITKATDGGFVVYETGTSATTYAVSAIAPGIDDTHVVLTVADMTVSEDAGVTVTYVEGGNGTVSDPAGNLLATDATGVEVAPWGA